MKNLIRYSFLLLGLLGLLSRVSYADPNDVADPTVITQYESGMSYVNGGIGQDQQETLKLQKDFNLHLTFAEKGTGAYLADVELHIQSIPGKKVITLDDMGPIFLAKLAPGKYQIKATSGDKTQTKTVVINKKGRKDLYFYW